MLPARGKNIRILRSISLLLLVAGLVACTSPRKSSQALSKEIINEIAAPEGAELLYLHRFEGLAKQGIGTHFGVRALYGVDAEYSQVVEWYSGRLFEQGWKEDFLTDVQNAPYYCHPDHEGVRLWVGNITEYLESPIPVEIISETEGTFETLYIVSVVRFPFD